MEQQEGLAIAETLSKPLHSSDQLLSIVASLLETLGLLGVDDALREYISPTRCQTQTSGRAMETEAKNLLRRQMGFIQKILIEKVWPDWEATIECISSGLSIKAFGALFFVEQMTETISSAPMELAVHSVAVISSILSKWESRQLRVRSLEIIALLIERALAIKCVEVVWHQIKGVQGSTPADIHASRMKWESFLVNLFSIPTKLANAYGAVTVDKMVPLGITERSFLLQMTQSFVSMMEMGFAETLPGRSSHLGLLLHHILQTPSIVGPPIEPDDKNVFDFLFLAFTPLSFPALPEALLRQSQSSRVLISIVHELDDRDLERLTLGVFEDIERRILPAKKNNAVYASVHLLLSTFGPLTPDREHLWGIVTIILARPNIRWSIYFAKVITRWLVDKFEAAELLLETVFPLWANEESIRHGIDEGRLFLTALNLFLIASLPKDNKALASLSRSSAFVEAIGFHLSLKSTLPRFLGMLVAEEVASRSMSAGKSMKPLSFGDVWHGDDPVRRVVQEIRDMMDCSQTDYGWQHVLENAYVAKKKAKHSQSNVSGFELEGVAHKPTNVETLMPRRPMITIISELGTKDDGQQLQPFLLPPSPSASYVETLQSEDASLYTSATPSNVFSPTKRQGRIRSPVYISELTAYLRAHDPNKGAESTENDAAERVEIGLQEGASLVRRKKNWGGELSENTVDLTILLLGLRDQYESEDFELKRQNLLIALVECCPTKAAPAIVEQYFYHSYSTSQKISMLTSLTLGARQLAGIPVSLPQTQPSHINPVNHSASARALHERLGGFPAEPPSDLAILNAQLTQAALSGARADTAALFPAASREKLLTVRRSESNASHKLLGDSSTPPSAPYIALAGEYFILPLINRFWLYLRDEATRPSTQNVKAYSRGSSTASLLEPLLLSHYYSTLSVLLHTAAHSSSFLAVLVPQSIAICLALKSDEGTADYEVIASQMEIILVALDASVSQDTGRTLMVGVDGGADMLGDIKSWAEGVFEWEEHRSTSRTGIGRAGRAAAGILLRLEEIFSRFREDLGW